MQETKQCTLLIARTCSKVSVNGPTQEHMQWGNRQIFGRNGQTGFYDLLRKLRDRPNRQHFPRRLFVEIICFISVVNKHEQLSSTSSAAEEWSLRFFLPALLENEWIRFGQFSLSYFNDPQNQKGALSKCREKHEKLYILSWLWSLKMRRILF